MYRKPSHLEVQLEVHLWPFFTPFSRKWAKVPHWRRRPGPEVQQATKMEPTGVKIGTPGDQSGDRGCLNAARGLGNTFQTAPFSRKRAKVPTGLAGPDRSSKKLLKSSPRVSKYGPQVIRMVTESV